MQAPGTHKQGSHHVVNPTWGSVSTELGTSEASMPHMCRLASGRQCREVVTALWWPRLGAAARCGQWFGKGCAVPLLWAGTLQGSWEGSDQRQQEAGSCRGNLPAPSTAEDGPAPSPPCPLHRAAPGAPQASPKYPCPWRGQGSSGKTGRKQELL